MEAESGTCRSRLPIESEARCELPESDCNKQKLGERARRALWLARWDKVKESWEAERSKESYIPGSEQQQQAAARGALSHGGGGSASPCWARAKRRRETGGLKLGAEKMNRSFNKSQSLRYFGYNAVEVKSKVRIDSSIYNLDAVFSLPFSSPIPFPHLPLIPFSNEWRPSSSLLCSSSPLWCFVFLDKFQYFRSFASEERNLFW